MITNYRIIDSEQGELNYNQIDDVLTLNQRSERNANFYMVGTGGQFRYRVGNIKGKAVNISDILITSADRRDITIRGVQDPQSIVRLIKSLQKTYIQRHDR